jgi:trans-aconitate methyltransferase
VSSVARSLPAVRAFYDARLQRQLEDFVEGNSRVECAWQTVERFAPRKPARVLEIGCGIGGVSWRMSRRWPQAEVVGLDVSHELVRTAETLFTSPRLVFLEGPLSPGRVRGRFDLIVLMDVYEHIAESDRAQFHQAIAELVDESARIIVSAPTPRHLQWLRDNHPEEIQPVDEDVTLDVLLALASATGSELSFYREVDVWHEGDYLHAVLLRRRGFPPVAGERARRRRWSIGLARSSETSSRKERAALVRARLARQVE